MVSLFELRKKSLMKKVEREKKMQKAKLAKAAEVARKKEEIAQLKFDLARLSKTPGSKAVKASRAAKVRKLKALSVSVGKVTGKGLVQTFKFLNKLGENLEKAERRQRKRKAPVKKKRVVKKRK